MTDKEKPAMSDARKRANAKYDKEHFEYVTFKARKGSRARIKKAAEKAGDSTNLFIRKAVNKAVIDAIGKPMEDDTTVKGK